MWKALRRLWPLSWFLRRLAHIADEEREMYDASVAALASAMRMEAKQRNIKLTRGIHYTTGNSQSRH